MDKRIKDFSITLFLFFFGVIFPTFVHAQSSPYDPYHNPYASYGSPNYPEPNPYASYGNPQNYQPETYTQMDYYYNFSPSYGRSGMPGAVRFGSRFDRSDDFNFSSGISSYQGTSTGPGPNGGYPGTPRGIYPTNYVDTSVFPNTYRRAGYY